jgi:hypothetical protein
MANFGAGSELENFLERLGIEDQSMYDLTKQTLAQEGVSVEQLYTMISDEDLEEIGVPEIARRLIKAAVQVRPSTEIVFVFQLIPFPALRAEIVT